MGERAPPPVTGTLTLRNSSLSGHLGPKGRRSEGVLGPTPWYNPTGGTWRWHRHSGSDCGGEFTEVHREPGGVRAQPSGYSPALGALERGADAASGAGLQQPTSMENAPLTVQRHRAAFPGYAQPEGVRRRAGLREELREILTGSLRKSPPDHQGAIPTLSSPCVPAAGRLAQPGYVSTM